MRMQKVPFLSVANSFVQRRLSAWVVAKLATMLIWMAVAYVGVSWGLRAMAPNTTSQVTAVPAKVEADIDDAGVLRVLGAQPAVAAQAPTLVSRFQLVGVLNGDADVGVALISVDGKPAKPYRVGKSVAEGLVVQSTLPKRVSLGVSADGPVTLTLDLPAKK